MSNDLDQIICVALPRHWCLLYADDSALLVSGKSVSEIETSLSKELSNVSDWLVNNKLSLHLGKTESILFGSQKRIKKRQTLNISCGDCAISAQNSVGYLGLQLGQTLNGEHTYNKILTISNSRLKFLYRQARFLNQRTRQTLVSALVQPHFDYACSSWYYGLKKKHKDRLQTCQNKIIRFVLGLGPRTHIGAVEFNRTGWLPVNYRVWQIGLHHMFKILNGLAPAYLSHGITRVADTHSHFTRSSRYGLVVPRLGSNGQRSFKFNAIKSWNDLPVSIQSCIRFNQFKSSLKRHFATLVPH